MENKHLETHLFQLHIDLLDEKSRLEQRIEKIITGLDEITDILSFSQYFKDNELANTLNKENNKLSYKRIEDYNCEDLQKILEKYNKHDDDDNDNDSDDENKLINDDLIKPIMKNIMKRKTNTSKR